MNSETFAKKPERKCHNISRLFTVVLRVQSDLTDYESGQGNDILPSNSSMLYKEGILSKNTDILGS